MSLINARALGLPKAAGFIGDTLDDLTGAYSGITGGLVSAPAAAAKPAYSAIYSFGDSLSDTGNDYALSLHTLPAAPYASGHFTNGAVWVQDLAVSLGLPSPGPSVLGGTDFAYGGGETGAEALHPQNPADLASQLAQFTARHLTPEPNALYTLAVGANDVFDAIAAYSANPGAALTDIKQAVANETSFIAGLAATGARNFVLLNVPDLGKTPSATTRGARVVQVASSLSAQFNSKLSASLNALAAANRLNLHIVDTYALLDRGVANPAAFGLTNVTQPVWTGTYNNPASGTLNAKGTAQNGYLFFDSIHPTATGHSIIAAAAKSSLLPTA